MDRRDAEGTARRRRRRTPGAAVLLTAMFATPVLFAAGCGGGGPHASVASLAPTTTRSGSPSAGAGGGSSPAGSGSSRQSSGGGGGAAIQLAGPNLAKFAACMRSHGEPNFPDPKAGGQISISSASGIDPRSPRFQTAQQACQKLMPKGGTPSPAQQAQMQKQMLAFSSCMRSHGVPGFPDPTFSKGGASLEIHAGSGLDPGSPQFQAAQSACQKDLPGKPSAAPPGAASSGQ